MSWAIVGTIFKSISLGVFDTIKHIASESTVRGGLLLHFLGRQSTNAASVMKMAMNHNIYWYFWGAAAFFSVLWYATGMIYSTFPWLGEQGLYVAELEDAPELKAAFDAVWSNIFWTGAAGYGIHTAGRIIERIWRL